MSYDLELIEKNIMDGLKDFQRATVDRIEYLYKNGRMRVLVSDEVGLGKTLIARGTVAKVARLARKNKNGPIKIVYICSNIAIAEQNLNKLRITKETQSASAGCSRLSMQHLNIFMQENNAEYHDKAIELIPLTPETSFKINNSCGTQAERALMFEILRDIPEIKKYEAQLDVMMENTAYSSWGWYKDEFHKKVDNCERASRGKYRDYMQISARPLLEQKQESGKTLLCELTEHLGRIKAGGNKRIPCTSLIVKLRTLFAQISLDKLNPDLVILDEFQRFKYLISSDPHSETGILAEKFFNSDDVRMLLLSATPYKMYSTLEEIDETMVDEHYSEFLHVMDFLNITDEERSDFRTVWNDYSVKLKELTSGNTAVLCAKSAAEDAMYRHICRTERISERKSADIIDDSTKNDFLDVSKADIQSYLQAQKLLEDIGKPFNVPIDYIKSSPYLMSFMRNYKLKKHVDKHFTDNPDQVGKANKKLLWLNRSKIENFERIPPNNARLERVSRLIFENNEGNAELLLWVPPSLPYYEPQGVYKNASAFTKTIIFSSWEMVPRMISGLLSYEAERRTVGEIIRSNTNIRSRYSAKKRYPQPRLRFSADDGTLFCLMYPSRFLADIYDPIDCMRRRMKLSDTEAEIKKNISEKIKKNPNIFKSPDTGAADRRWYCLAPLLLDYEESVTGDSSKYAASWLDNGTELFGRENEAEKKETGQKLFLENLGNLNNLYRQALNGDSPLGRMPADLIEVLCDMAIASPAVCIHRTYRRYSDSFGSKLPTQVSKLFINRMNSPEATAAVMLSSGKHNDDAHWMNLLTYCKNGNIQSMFDEYAHLITNGLDKNGHLIETLHEIITDSMNINTATYTAYTYEGLKAKVNGNKENNISLRTHFAVAFTKGDGKNEDADRKKVVRNAFNSPFRPFVLASTSIGQEGLDFHNYCRRIVHWNLPSNPIDLEQREGRINRFECLAIRQNVANRYGDPEGFKSRDIWKELFEIAAEKEKAKAGNASELIPYWGLTEGEDMVRIERIVPMYPFSRDGMAYDRLMKILNHYRITLGQARQEELIEYILNNRGSEDDLSELFINLSPYYR